MAIATETAAGNGSEMLRFKIMGVRIARRVIAYPKQVPYQLANAGKLLSLAKSGFAVKVLLTTMVTNRSRSSVSATKS